MISYPLQDLIIQTVAVNYIYFLIIIIKKKNVSEHDYFLKHRRRHSVRGARLHRSACALGQQVRRNFAGGGGGGA